MHEHVFCWSDINWEDVDVATSYTAPRGTSDQAIWNRVLTLHTHVERELALMLQRRHGIGLSEYRSITCLTCAGSETGPWNTCSTPRKASCACRTWPTKWAWGNRR